MNMLHLKQRNSDIFPSVFVFSSTLSNKQRTVSFHLPECRLRSPVGIHGSRMHEYVPKIAITGFHCVNYHDSVEHGYFSITLRLATFSLDIFDTFIERCVILRFDRRVDGSNAMIR